MQIPVAGGPAEHVAGHRARRRSDLRRRGGTPVLCELRNGASPFSLAFDPAARHMTTLARADGTMQPPLGDLSRPMARPSRWRVRGPGLRSIQHPLDLHEVSAPAARDPARPTGRDLANALLTHGDGRSLRSSSAAAGAGIRFSSSNSRASIPGAGRATRQADPTAKMWLYAHAAARAPMEGTFASRATPARGNIWIDSRGFWGSIMTQEIKNTGGGHRAGPAAEMAQRLRAPPCQKLPEPRWCSGRGLATRPSSRGWPGLLPCRRRPTRSLHWWCERPCRMPRFAERDRGHSARPRAGLYLIPVRRFCLECGIAWLPSRLSASIRYVHHA